MFAYAKEEVLGSSRVKPRGMLLLWGVESPSTDQYQFALADGWFSTSSFLYW